MTVIGLGNTGCKLATMLDEDALLLSTAKEDTNNFTGKNIITFSENGATKRFTTGLRIWNENYDKLKATLSNIENDKVIMFAALGGGSGSSSLRPVSEILLEQGNKILVVGILPFKKEVNPPLSNSVQSINNLMPIISQVSVVIFDNNKLLKDYENDWNKVNSYIVKRVDYMINLLDKYNTDGYSPLTLDKSELESVVFGGGFIDVSEDFLEEKLPKFTYGRLDKTTKNCLIVMFVDTKVSTEKKMHEYMNIMTTVQQRVAGRASNSRMIPGILRAQINYTNAEDDKVKDRAYLCIASGINIEKYVTNIEKIKDVAVSKAEVFAEEYKGKSVLKKRDKNILDI
jgi:cell division GTPase FtsZ